MSLIIIIIAQVFGIISWLLLLYSYTKEDINKLLFIQILVCLFDVISYLLLGADAGLLICIVELVKTILYYKTDKDKLIFRVGIIFYLLIGLLVVKKWYTILPVLASFIDSFGTSKDSKSANICSIISNTLWTVYDILILSYVGALNDIVVVMCNISVLALGYSRIMHISKFRIIKYTYITNKVLNKIYNLDLKTYGKENVWPQEYQRELFEKNNDSLFVIKYKHDIVGYINYLNLIETEYERLKRIRKSPEKLDIYKIIEFKSNRKNHILIESINVKKEYEKPETIALINKKLNSFIKLKHNRRVYIDRILAFALSDFEKHLYETLGFTKIRELEDNTFIYEKEINIKDVKNA